MHPTDGQRQPPTPPGTSSSSATRRASASSVRSDEPISVPELSRSPLGEGPVTRHLFVRPLPLPLFRDPPIRHTHHDLVVTRTQKPIHQHTFRVHPRRNHDLAHRDRPAISSVGDGVLHVVQHPIRKRKRMFMRQHSRATVFNAHPQHERAFLRARAVDRRGTGAHDPFHHPVIPATHATGVFCGCFPGLRQFIAVRFAAAAWYCEDLDRVSPRQRDSRQRRA
jgi:hypothetical protein